MMIEILALLHFWHFDVAFCEHAANDSATRSGLRPTHLSSVIFSTRAHLFHVRAHIKHSTELKRFFFVSSSHKTRQSVEQAAHYRMVCAKKKDENIHEFYVKFPNNEFAKFDFDCWRLVFDLSTHAWCFTWWAIDFIKIEFANMCFLLTSIATCLVPTNHFSNDVNRVYFTAIRIDAEMCERIHLHQEVSSAAVTLGSGCIFLSVTQAIFERACVHWILTISISFTLIRQIA